MQRNPLSGLVTDVGSAKACCKMTTGVTLRFFPPVAPGPMPRRGKRP